MNSDFLKSWEDTVAAWIEQQQKIRAPDMTPESFKKEFVVHNISNRDFIFWRGDLLGWSAVNVTDSSDVSAALFEYSPETKENQSEKDI